MNDGSIWGILGWGFYSIILRRTFQVLLIVGLLLLLTFFFGPHPPSVMAVQQIVDSQWQKRAPILVKRLSDFFIFFCAYGRDVEALLDQHTTIVEG